MGATVCAAVDADPGLELVAAVDPAYANEKLEPWGLVASASPEAMAEAGVQVAVDFTVATAAAANARWCAHNGVHAVIGTTGFSPAVLAEMRAWFEAGAANCVLAPNFAIGAVLMMRFAELAAPWFETAEIVELHHDRKLDAPSGTALLTAQRIASARTAEAAAANAGLGNAGLGNSGLGNSGLGNSGLGNSGLGSSGTGISGIAISGTGSTPAVREEAAARGAEGAPGVQVHSVRLRGLVAHHEVLFGSAGQVLTLRHDSLDRASFMPGVLLAIRSVPSRRGFTLGLDPLLGI
jgi:4-hydroxy-tetrahydrodipicolinate reductase